MENIVKVTFFYIIILIIVGVFSYRYGKNQSESNIEYVEVVKKQIDTLKIQLPPIEKKIIVYKEKNKKLKEEESKIDYPEEECKEIVDNLKEQLANCDTIVEYQDKIIYIDREIIKYQEVIIDNKVKYKPKPIGVGFQAGYGTDGKKMTPYVGAGVSVNFLNF